MKILDIITEAEPITDRRYNVNSHIYKSCFKNALDEIDYISTRNYITEDIPSLQGHIPTTLLTNNDIGTKFFPIALKITDGTRHINVFKFVVETELYGIDSYDTYYFKYNDSLYTVNNTSDKDGIQRIIFKNENEYRQFIILISLKFSDYKLTEHDYSTIKVAKVSLEEAKNNWIGGKHPGDMSEQEFWDTHYTGHIDSNAYKTTTDPTNPSWKKESKHELPKVIGKKTFKDISVEFRKSIEENRYVKKQDGEIVRDERGLATYMSRNEMRKKGLALYDQTIFVFHNNEYIGLASNEWGAIGVWIRDDYQGYGIGSFLLKLFMQENPDMQIGQMTDMGKGMARKVWELFYKDRHDENPTKQRELDWTLGEDIENLDEEALTRDTMGMGLEAFHNHDIAFYGGMRSGNSGPGETRLRYVIFDMASAIAEHGEENVSEVIHEYEVGLLELFLEDATQKIVGLVNIKITKPTNRKGGLGSAIVRSLLDSSFTNRPLRIHDIKKSAVPFWRKMGVQFTKSDFKTPIKTSSKTNLGIYGIIP